MLILISNLHGYSYGKSLIREGKHIGKNLDYTELKFSIFTFIEKLIQEMIVLLLSGSTGFQA